jgi:hypothetical protein
VLPTSEKLLLNVEDLNDARTLLADIFSILLGLCCEMGKEPFIDRCGHLAEVLPPGELVIGTRQEIQPLRSSQRVSQSQALMEWDTFILLTLDN